MIDWILSGISLKFVVIYISQINNTADIDIDLSTFHRQITRTRK